MQLEITQIIFQKAIFQTASNPQIVGIFQDSVAVNGDNKIRFLEKVVKHEQNENE